MVVLVERGYGGVGITFNELLKNQRLSVPYRQPQTKLLGKSNPNPNLNLYQIHIEIIVFVFINLNLLKVLNF